MEKVRGRIRRIRHRFELPSCMKAKKDVPSLIYTVLDRDSDRSSHIRGRHQHLRRQASCKERSSRDSYPRNDCKQVRDDCLGDVSFWSNDCNELFCEKVSQSGTDCWNVNSLADREGPTIRVATFDVALFSLAPAIPPEHPCACSTPGAAAAAHNCELGTPTHFHSSDSSSIFSDKSKSNSSDASSGMNSFSNSRESTDSSEMCAILSHPSSKPTPTFNVCPSLPPKHPPLFDISKAWRSSSPSRTKSTKPSTPKSRTLSPFKPISGKNNGCGNFYHSKLNPVFGLSGSGSSSRCLMDSIPSLFSDLLTLSNKGPGDEERYVSLPRHFSHESIEEKPMCSPSLSTFSQFEFSPCNSGFQTPLHTDLFPSDSCAASPYTSSPPGRFNPLSPLNNSVCLSDSPHTILSPQTPRFFRHPDTPQAQSTSSGIATSILDILLDVDADIIALQEVRAEEERQMKPLSELAEALGMEYAYAESWAPEFGNAVLSRWPIKSASVQQIHDETDYRNVLKVVVEVPLVGDLHVYCTQLDHLDEDWRMKQVDSFLHTVPASQPHILAGNFNSLERSDYSKGRWEEITQARKQDRKLSPRGDVLRKLVKERSYKDAKIAMGDGLMEAGLRLRGQGVDGTCQHGTRVDYILGSPKLPLDFVPGSYAVISSRGTSNHDLALVDLQPHCFQ